MAIQMFRSGPEIAVRWFFRQHPIQFHASQAKDENLSLLPMRERGICAKVWAPSGKYEYFQ
jgi:hypothetical protein